MKKAISIFLLLIATAPLCQAQGLKDAYRGFRKIIKRHIQLYENEPLFQIFTFVHSEKYFNKNAAEIAENKLTVPALLWFTRM